MKIASSRLVSFRWLLVVVPFYAALCLSVQVSAQAIDKKKLPAELADWSDWATWDDMTPSVPSAYSDAGRKMPVWSSVLNLKVAESKGEFNFDVSVYHASWLELPGSRSAWPLSVMVDGEAVAVMEKNGVPCIYLQTGAWTVTGEFRWAEMPQLIDLPKTIGILDLARNGERVEIPSWDNNGKLWLKRTTKEAADKNYLAAQVYRNLVDGSPMWLSTDVELTVTGKSREEKLGAIIPEGWQISSLRAPIPCAVDDDGLLKSQVRAGKWTISLVAFRTSPAETIQYADGVKPIVTEELISLQNQPNFRLIEFSNVLAVDVAQTTFPEKWRNLPVHQWENTKPITIIEKMRGMGQQKAAGVAISRDFWLDEDGKQLTYRDVINGSALQTWRLDAAEGQRLGAAKIDNESQLITKNPLNGATGVEIRVRELNLQSVGRMDRQAKVSATGWQHDAESLQGTLYLPPGWRVFAVFGPDSSYGDWLTSWSLLDVFFLLIFTVAIFRLWGWKLGLLAFAAFVLSYHEAGTPRFVWLLLLVALVLYRALPAGTSGKWKKCAKFLSYAAAVLVLLGLVPFVSKQMQQALYPQLESHSVVGTYDYNTKDGGYMLPNLNEEVSSMDDAFGSNLGSAPRTSGIRKGSYSNSSAEKQNLRYDSKAKIQTGPAVPEWSWRSVSFEWSGPVSADEKISFVLIPLWLQRILTVSRVILLLSLLYSLLRLIDRDGFKGTGTAKEPLKSPFVKSSASLLLLSVTLGAILSANVQAQFPDAEMLKTLRNRILQEPAGITKFAEIPEVKLNLDGRKLAMEVTVHTAKKTAVPLPGRLPVWSPISVQVDGVENISLSRFEGFLWIVLEAGTHRVQVEGMVPAGDWEWSFMLKPQYVDIQAPEWTVTGLKPNGIPENQVFFVEQNRTEGAEAAYDRNDFNPILKVDRSIELGLLWQSKTTVRRLSPAGKAVSISLPLLPGERILSQGLNAENGRIEIRLGAQETAISWESELTQSPELILNAEANEQWVEQWQVIASSVWNLTLDGLDPIFENRAAEIVPIWKPWPGESATLNIARPEAIAGETMTIRQAIHKMNLGSRQRSSSLKLSLQTSLGSDFILKLAPEATVSSLMLNGVETPVRKEGDKVIVPLRPGEQEIELAWKTPTTLAFRSLGDEVQLPVDCANTSTIISLSSDDRWVLWTDGPRRGPAVRMWSIFIAVLIFGMILGRIKSSPLRSYEWVALLLGLTQIPLLAGFSVVAWLFWVSLKARFNHVKVPALVFNFNQLLIVAGVIPVVLIMLVVLHKGLLGEPEMRILGEGSSAGNLEWFQARGENSALPVPSVVSISIWFYRSLMLIWAVWLAFAVLRWARWTWNQLALGGFWKEGTLATKRSDAGTPPPVPSVTEMKGQEKPS
ncbi:MAG: hypothetical protein ACSHX0_09485 [Akkermansiaceae bacterium]